MEIHTIIHTGIKKTFIYSFLVFLLVVPAIAQEEEKNIIQFTGVVFLADSNNVIPGVHVYVPKGGRGTTTNPYGFFSMVALEGDSVVFSAVGYERAYYIIPKHDKEHSLKHLIYLKEDITYLEEVEILPYPSENSFKAAVLASVNPYQRDLNNLNEWMAENYYQLAYKNLPASPTENLRYYAQQQMAAEANRYGPQGNPLLNPFAWASFIRSLRKKN